MIIPFCPPNARPIIISSSVSAVSRNAVLNVFPISFVFLVVRLIGCYVILEDAVPLRRPLSRFSTPIRHTGSIFCGRRSAFAQHPEFSKGAGGEDFPLVCRN